MADDRRWVDRVIREEKPAAAMLIVAAALGLGLTNLIGYEHIAPLLDSRHTVLQLSLSEFIADGPLAVFFFIAGLELRHELTQGALAAVRQAAVPVVAAASGMAAPALLFLLLAPRAATGAWGVPMATDIPLSLAVISILGTRLPAAFRAFILSLAIVDDMLSIVVIAVAFGQAPSIAWLLVAAALVWLYALLVPRSLSAAAVVALLGWLATLESGVHPTVLGAALGLATVARGDELRERIQPWSSWVILPLFIMSALAMPVRTSSADWRLAGAVIVARIVGKPLGVALGALFVIALLKPRVRMNATGYLLAGTTASLGFSVPMLFAELSLSGPLLQAMKLAVLLALMLAALLAFGSMWLLRTRVTEVRQAGM